MKTLSDLENTSKIQTNSRIDELLDGGIEKGIITQIFGPPSSGKSNIALALAVNVAKQGKKSIYIDTEGGISLDRIKQIARFDFSKILKYIHVLEPTTFNEQNNNIKSLDLWISNNYEGIDLIVLDSAVALYRVEDKRSPNVNNDFSKQIEILLKIARKFNIAVVLTNQIYNSFDEGKDNVNPVGGTILQYRSKTMIQLEKSDELHERIASIRKHRSIAEGKTTKFKITSNGIV
ncbi:MAG: DNA repair and recombination protein RadB [Methanobrevibacter sp.]|nr:DNA repair and recombination protein RadB [Methanobrevibacter sp.]